MGGAGNAAVVAVGRTFFRVAIVGYTLSGLAMFPSVILGVSKGYFEWEMDRCTCVVEQEADAAAGSIVSSTSLSGTGTTAAASSSCVFGQDFAKVSIGWKEFTYDELVHTVGCPVATATYEANPALDDDDLNLDNERSLYFFDKVYPLDGEFQKTDNPTQADESNGGAEAGGGVVAMQVVLAFFSILTYKMLKASYLSNGSHCSIGLALMTRLNLLVGVGTAAAVVSYWWLIEGRFGDEQKALTTAIENVRASFMLSISLLLVYTRLLFFVFMLFSQRSFRYFIFPGECRSFCRPPTCSTASQCLPGVRARALFVSSTAFVAQQHATIFPRPPVRCSASSRLSKEVFVARDPHPLLLLSCCSFSLTHTLTPNVRWCCFVSAPVRTKRALRDDSSLASTTDDEPSQEVVIRFTRTRPPKTLCLL